MKKTTDHSLQNHFPLICSLTVGASPWRGASVQRNHRVFGPRHVVAVDDANNNTISNTQPKKPTTLSSKLFSSYWIM